MTCGTFQVDKRYVLIKTLYKRPKKELKETVKRLSHNKQTLKVKEK